MHSMERLCPLRRAGCTSRSALGSSVRPRGACCGSSAHLQRQTRCSSSSNDGSFGKGLTRSQAGRRQRARRKISPSLVTSWSASDPTPSRTQWLEGAKQQETQVLLGALLTPESVPLQRLPVLLTLLEGRPNLDEALLAVELPAVAAAVLRSDLLQRLLPGGVLHELLLNLIAEQAPDWPTEDLLQASQLVAAWQPPAGGMATAVAAAALAAVLTDRAHGWQPDSTNNTSRSGNRDERVAAVQSEVSQLTEALTCLQPWLQQYAAAPGPAEDGDFAFSESLGNSGLEGHVLAEAKVAVAVMMQRVVSWGLSAAAGPAALNSIVSAAAAYGVDVPADVIRAASGAAAETSSSPQNGTQASAAVRLAARLVVRACLGAHAVVTSGEPGSAAGDPAGESGFNSTEVSTLVASRLAPGRDPVQVEAFLLALRECLQPDGQQEHQQRPQTPPSGKATATGPAQRVAKEAEQQLQRRGAVAGLLEALGAAAGGLGMSALAIAMDCATLAMDTVANDGGKCIVDLGMGLFEAAAATTRQQLLAAASALASQPEPLSCTADQLCFLAAAAVRLQTCWLWVAASSAMDVDPVRADTDVACVAATDAILAAVAKAPLHTASVEAAAALLGAPLETPARFSQQEAAALERGGDSGADNWGLLDPSAGPNSPTPLALPTPVFDALLERLKAAANAAAAAGEEANRRGAPGARGRPVVTAPAAAVDTPLTEQLSSHQATAILRAVAVAAEAAACEAPSTSTSSPLLPPDRAEAFSAAALAACRALTPAVRRLDLDSAISLLHLLARCVRAGVCPSHPPLMWALHERLRVFASGVTPLPPHGVLQIFRGLVALGWRPPVLLRELLTPLLQWLRLPEASPDLREFAAAPLSPDVPPLPPRLQAWTPCDVRRLLVQLARLGDVSQLTFTCVKQAGTWLLCLEPEDDDEDEQEQEHRKLDLLQLQRKLQLRQKESSGADGATAVAEGAHQPRKPGEEQQQQWLEQALQERRQQRHAARAANNLTKLLWVCVVLRYRATVVLRPLVQRLLQIPVAAVPVNVASQALWAAARLGVVGERLTRWALACCQGEGKLLEAPPRSLAMLCWGLGKLGFRPPQAFQASFTAAMVAKLPQFSPEELATTLFGMAVWRGSLAGAGGAAAVQHVIATRDSLDGPALCTATWALQRLLSRGMQAAPRITAAGVSGGSIGAESDGGTNMASPGSVSPVASWDAAEGGVGVDGLAASAAAAAAATGVGVGPLNAAALAAMEGRLVELWANKAQDPRGAFTALPEHQFLRFCTACAAAGYRPDRLLDSYLSTLPKRLTGILGRPRRPLLGPRVSRSLWVAARTLETFQPEIDPRVLPLLEAVSESWQEHLSPGQLAGIVHALATLGHYPSTWISRGLLRTLGLKLRDATVTQTGLIMEALAIWKDDIGRDQQQSAYGEQGNDQEALVVAAARAGFKRPVPRWIRSRPLTAMRFDQVRRVALWRLRTVLVAPAQPPPAPSPSGEPGPQQPQLRDVTLDPGATVAVPTNAAGVTGPAAGPDAPRAASERVSLDDSMRLLVAMATLGWRDVRVSEELVRVAARLPVLRRQKIPQLIKLLWALASLRIDAPELHDDIQGALLGLPRRRSLAAELAMLESGRVDLMSAVASGASSAPQLPTVSLPSASSTMPAEVAREAAAGGSESAGTVLLPVDPASDSSQPANTTMGITAATPASGADEGPGNAILLARPPVRPGNPRTQASDATSKEAAALGLDPVAAAAAAGIGQRYELQLDGPAGRNQLPSEPWSPGEIFKTLWACAKMNRNPGPRILAAAERSWLHHTARSGSAEGSAAEDGDGSKAPEAKPPLHTLTGLLWTLAVFRNHNDSFAQLLAAQLAARLHEGRGGEDEWAFQKQAVQVAACLLAAQADRLASPLNARLSPQTRATIVSAWRSRQASRLAQPLNRYQQEILSVLRKMGFTAAANVATPDGCVLVDLAVALAAPAKQPASGAGAAAAPAQPRLLALELVGPHNSAANSSRVTGEAVIKYRLLQARGYVVVPVLCSEWNRIKRGDVWAKMVYLQAKVERNAGGAAVAALGPPPAGSALAGPGLQTVVAHNERYKGGAYRR